MTDVLPDFAERIDVLIKALRFKSINSFASSIGVAASVVQNFLGKNTNKRKTKPGLETIEKILEAHPRVNPVYLLTGRGEPLFPWVAQEAINSHVVVGDGNAFGTNNKTRVQLGSLEDCQKELEHWRERAKLAEELALERKRYIEAMDQKKN